MRGIRSLIVTLAFPATAASALAQQAGPAETPDTPVFARSYWTFGGLYYANNSNYELMTFAGQSWPFGGGGWTLRAGLGAGVSFWGGNDTGFLGGPQAGLERTLTGDRIQLRDGQPLEIYALLGGSAYAGWNLSDAPEATELVPAAAGGLGLRWRGSTASDPIVRLELYYEERFADFEPRLYLRFDYLRPRGVEPASPPSPERP